MVARWKREVRTVSQGSSIDRGSVGMKEEEGQKKSGSRSSQMKKG